MKTVIYWFSSTGNSLVAARFLQAGLGSCELVPMCSSDPANASGFDRVGLVFPLYYLGYPALVRVFLARLMIPAGTSVFAAVTRGVTGMGGVLSRLEHDLNKKGVRTDSAVYLDMPNNDLTLFSVKKDSANQRRLRKSAGQMLALLEALVAGRHLRSAEPFGFLHNMRQAAYYRRIARSHTRFFADAGCRGCGICASLCPTGSLVMVGKRPIWNDGCQECEGCINLCPQKAIQYRGSRTEKKLRYCHPAITWKDIVGQRQNVPVPEEFCLPPELPLLQKSANQSGPKPMGEPGHLANV